MEKRISELPQTTSPSPTGDIPISQDGQTYRFKPEDLPVSDASAEAIAERGDVFGPNGATNNAVARFDEETGKLIQSSEVDINDAGDVHTSGGFISEAAFYNGIYLEAPTIGNVKYIDFGSENPAESIGFSFKVANILKAAFSLYTGNMDAFLDVYTTAGAKVLAWAANADAAKFVILPYTTGGKVGIGTYSPTHALDINADTIRLEQRRTIANSYDPGWQGEICYDDNYVYVCVAPNTWKRLALATW